MRYTFQSLPAMESRLEEIRCQQCQDDTCQLLIQYCQQGCPDKSQLTPTIRPYFSVANELSIEEGQLLRGACVVIPLSMREDILGQLHSGHQGIVKCRTRACQSVWWPGLSAQLQEFIKKCVEFAAKREHNLPITSHLVRTTSTSLPESWN